MLVFRRIARCDILTIGYPAYDLIAVVSLCCEGEIGLITSELGTSLEGYLLLRVIVIVRCRDGTTLGRISYKGDRVLLSRS